MKIQIKPKQNAKLLQNFMEKKNQMHLPPLSERFLFCRKLYFAMDQGFPLVICPISLCYYCCFAMPNTLESEGDNNCLISLKLKLFAPTNL